MIFKTAASMSLTKLLSSPTLMCDDCIKKTPKHQLPKPRLCLMIELFLFKGHVF